MHLASLLGARGGRTPRPINLLPLCMIPCEFRTRTINPVRRIRKVGRLRYREYVRFLPFLLAFYRLSSRGAV